MGEWWFKLTFVDFFFKLTNYACQVEYTVKHILIEWTDLAHIRETVYSANDMKELFRKK